VCPDYEVDIKTLLTAHKTSPNVPDEAIPEAIADVIAERFSEPEPEEAAVEDNQDGDRDGEHESASAANGDRIEQAQQKLDDTRSALLRTKQKLTDLESDVEALKQKQEQEIVAISKTWTGSKADLRSHLKPLKQGHKAAVNTLKEAQKDKAKLLKTEIKALETQIPRLDYELRSLTNRGKLELILEDAELIGTLKERWIDAEVAKQLDYPIFMAVSERGGKDNSGDYGYLLDEQGSLVEFPEGHPQEGQLVVDQDLVNYDFRAADLVVAAKLSNAKICVAEAFVRFAQEQKLSFWGSE
jgi:type I restriction enzyme M protein